MKAAELRNWNEFSLVEKPKPTIGGDEVLLKVRYGGICGSDLTVYRGLHPTATVPVVLCHEILAEIEQLPDGYAGDFEKGERVLVNPVISCGSCSACRDNHGNACANLKLMGIHVDGGFAEYAKTTVDKLVKVNPDLPDEVAALGEPFAVAWHVNRRLDVREGEKVLVLGAGLIGIVVALGAIYRGAEVHISEINEGRRELAKQFGIAAVNPMESDIGEYAKAHTGGDGFDVVIDAAGAEQTVGLLPDLGRVGGRIVSLGLGRRLYPFMIGAVSFKEQTVIGSRLYSMEDFKAGVRMLEEMSVKNELRKLVSDIFSLNDIMSGFEMVIGGKNSGKVLIDARI